MTKEKLVKEPVLNPPFNKVGVAQFYVKIPKNTVPYWQGCYVTASYLPPNPIVRIEVKPKKVEASSVARSLPRRTK